LLHNIMIKPRAIIRKLLSQHKICCTFT